MLIRGTARAVVSGVVSCTPPASTLHEVLENHISADNDIKSEPSGWREAAFPAFLHFSL